MNAALKPIEARCIERPEWDNTHIERGALWILKNDAKLRERYEALGGVLPKVSGDRLLEFAHSQKFLTFCQCQLDGERLRRMS